MALIHDRLGLVPVINAAGTMTALGASRAIPEAAAAVSEILSEFVDIAALQAKASAEIAAATGAEAGFVTSSAASGITLGVAAAMTGADLATIARLPDAHGLPCKIVIPAGHLIDFGASVAQMIRLAGARPVSVGTVFDVQPFHVSAALTDRAAAGLYVISHHVAASGQIGLEAFIGCCHARGVPVIVDMASEHDLTGAISLGADLVIWSAHKFLGGPTAGIVAGRRTLVRAACLQNRGIGRAMKVGKEGIAGAIAALEAWSNRDHAGIRRREDAIIDEWIGALAGHPGLELRRLPDWTGNPIERVEMAVGPASGLHAWELADRLAARVPSVRVRDDIADTGRLHLDPCNLDAQEARQVASAVIEELDRAAKSGDGCMQSWEERRRQSLSALLKWPRPHG